jgi:hypothetical protein
VGGRAEAPGVGSFPEAMQLARSLLEKDYVAAQEKIAQMGNVMLSLNEDNIFHWKLEISGGKETIWDGTCPCPHRLRCLSSDM